MSTICKFIEFEFTITSSKTTLTEDLITNAFYVIGDWVMSDQKILKSKELLKKIFKVLEIGMGRTQSKDLNIVSNNNSNGSNNNSSSGSNSNSSSNNSGNTSPSSSATNVNSTTQSNSSANTQHSSTNSPSVNVSQSSLSVPSNQPNSTSSNTSNNSTSNSSPSVAHNSSNPNLSTITVIHQDKNLFNATHRIRVFIFYF